MIKYDEPWIKALRKLTKGNLYALHFFRNKTQGSCGCDDDA